MFPFPPLAVLFVDFNAFFASVEQQLRPELRGKPVGVVPLNSETTCCIAASYEARAHGVRTGTRIWEARRLCPGLQLVEARPAEYLRVHRRIVEVVESRVSVKKVHSIDEMACRLPSGMRSREGAREVALDLKETLAREIGPWVRCSVGVASNTLLAKLATDIQKPDGLVVLRPEELPGRVAGLPIETLSGVGRRMSARLRGLGMSTIGDMYAFSELEMRKVWGGVVGQRMWHALRGREVEWPHRPHQSVGHQHVLPPEFKTLEGAREVMLRLLLKGVLRAHHIGHAPSRVVLSLRFEEHPEHEWAAHAALGEGCVDFREIVRTALDLWAGAPRLTPKWINVTLADLRPLHLARPLFAEEQRGERLIRAVYAVNARHGRHALYPASMHGARDAAPGGIAFQSVPDSGFFDALGAGVGRSDAES